jgi:hypothetical protein
MRHLPNKVPTWKSYGLHKVCKCSICDCSCKRLQRSSCIDNAYVSLEAKASLKVLDVTTNRFLITNQKIYSEQQPCIVLIIV